MTSTKERGYISSHQLREESDCSFTTSGGESCVWPKASWKSGSEITLLLNTTKGTEATLVEREGDRSSVG